jgi:hypothetical protein
LGFGRPVSFRATGSGLVPSLPFSFLFDDPRESALFETIFKMLFKKSEGAWFWPKPDHLLVAVTIRIAE